MFEKKSCPNCGEKLKDEWSFCPRCGEELNESEFEIDIVPFRNMLDNIDKEFERIDKMVDEDFKMPAFKIKPMAGGISITLHAGDERPQVEVKTSGNYKRMEPEIRNKLGVAAGKGSKFRVKTAKVTEEPESEIKTVGGRQIILIKLPGVKKPGDIEVKRLDQSVEVKAFAGDKAYFKLIPVSGDAEISESFKDGSLRLEIER